MAEHVEQQLIEAVVALLTGLPTTGANVFQDRIYPYDDSELPCLNISTSSENTDYLTIHKPRIEAQTISLTVEVVAQQVTDLLKTLRRARKEVQAVMAANQSIGGLAKSLKRIGTNTAKDSNTERPIAVATMTYEIQIYCFENTPDVAIT